MSFIFLNNFYVRQQSYFIESTEEERRLEKSKVLGEAIRIIDFCVFGTKIKYATKETFIFNFLLPIGFY